MSATCSTRGSGSDYFKMKRLILVFGCSLCILIAQASLVARAETEPLVIGSRIIVAFFPPVTKAELQKDADTNEALADFQFYATRLREPLKKAGIDFHEVYAHAFRVRVGKTITTFRPAAGDVGYYFVAPGKRPRIEYGVMTDADLLQVANEYFKLASQVNDDIRLRAKVKSVVPLTDFSGVVTPVDVDPRFAVTVQIESATPATTEFNVGAAVTLAIHSPSLLFGGEPTKGQTYEFLLHRRVEDGKVRFFDLKVRPLSIPDRQHLLDGQFTLVTSTAAMPRSLKNAFAVISSARQFEMADIGKDYQATDFVVKPGLPSRRLIFAGTNGEKWFIHYEHGGRGHNYAVVVFTANPQGGVEFLWGGEGIVPARDLDDLRNKLADGRFSDDATHHW